MGLTEELAAGASGNTICDCRSRPQRGRLLGRLGQARSCTRRPAPRDSRLAVPLRNTVRLWRPPAPAGLAQGAEPTLGPGRKLASAAAGSPDSELSFEAAFENIARRPHWRRWAAPSGRACANVAAMWPGSIRRSYDCRDMHRGVSGLDGRRAQARARVRGTGQGAVQLAPFRSQRGRGSRRAPTDVAAARAAGACIAALGENHAWAGGPAPPAAVGLLLEHAPASLRHAPVRVGASA